VEGGGGGGGGGGGKRNMNPVVDTTMIRRLSPPNSIETAPHGNEYANEPVTPNRCLMVILIYCLYSCKRTAAEPAETLPALNQFHFVILKKKNTTFLFCLAIIIIIIIIIIIGGCGGGRSAISSALTMRPPINSDP